MIGAPDREPSGREVYLILFTVCSAYSLQQTLRGLHCITKFNEVQVRTKRASSSVVVKALCYKPEGRVFETR
jgi:hypothetical protein